MSVRQNDDNSKQASGRFSREELLLRFITLTPEERLKEFRPVSEVAELLNLHARTIRDWILYDKIIAIKLGEKKQYIYVPSLNEFLVQMQDV